MATAPNIDAEYRVTYWVATAGDPSKVTSRDRRSARVSVGLNGRTSFADIPKIIAIKHGLEPGEVVVYSADLVSLEVDGVKQ